jgi:hypothetical protein
MTYSDQEARSDPPWERQLLNQEVQLNLQDIGAAEILKEPPEG